MRHIALVVGTCIIVTSLHFSLSFSTLSLADKLRCMYGIHHGTCRTYSDVNVVLVHLIQYVYHDVMDKRWRPVSSIFFYLFLYSILYSVSGTIIIAYIVIQGIGRDFKELGASVVTVILGSYEALKLFRLARILLAHRRLVQILRLVDKSLAKLAGLLPNGFEYDLLKHSRREPVSFFLGSRQTDSLNRHMVSIVLLLLLLFTITNDIIAVVPKRTECTVHVPLTMLYCVTLLLNRCCPPLFLMMIFQEILVHVSSGFHVLHRRGE